MDYFEKLENETNELYKIANEARSKGLDPEVETEIPLAKDLAERVEGLVGPKGVAKRIKELELEMSREELAFQISAEIATEEFKCETTISDKSNKNRAGAEENGKKGHGGKKDKSDPREKYADQALRTALAILTEGVVAAPLEGIASVKIKKNPNGTDYLAVYFAGPIRSAGGTAAALAVLIGDKIRLAINIDKYIPNESEIERYVEEVELYESEVTNLQYSPKPEEVRIAARNIPVEVTGEPTDQIEVSHRDLERVETNNIRGGALLAMVEGVIQKSPKVLKYSYTLKLPEWGWLEEFSKKDNKADDDTNEDSNKTNTKINCSKYDNEEDYIFKRDSKYIQDIIGGRPVLGYPSEKGGFRLRYGRSRNTGLAAMGVNPATMELLEFLAVGTQLKIEKPGKGNCVVPVDSIEGPIVKLKNGDVVKINSVKQARKLRNNVAEVIFLGDMLVAFGEFLRNNQTLLPSAWCEEWWIETVIESDKYKKELNEENKKSGFSEFKIFNNLKTPEDHNNLGAEDAFAISKYYGIPLHPKFTYFYHDLSLSDLNSFYSWISKFNNDFENKSKNDIVELDLNPEKRILEILGIPHTLKDEKVILDYDDYYALIHSVKGPFDDPNKAKDKNNNNKTFSDNKSNRNKNENNNVNENTKDISNHTILALNENNDVKIIAKSPTYIGTRVGRPEKSKERLMKPAPHVLFPIGTAGGSRRLIAEAAKSGPIQVEIARRKCTECHLNSFQSICPHCGAPTVIGSPGRKKINVSKFLKKAADNVDSRRLDEIKGVVGMISESKLPEPLEKGILRAKNDVFVFKDATIRHDSTDLPLTHFIPKEIGVSIEKLKEMGYEKDAYGNEILDEEQVIELKVQDVVISQNCANYLMGVANFIDDLLDKFYGMDRFYYVRQKEELIGHLIAGLAPHTSAGVLGRIVGFTSALACYAHPFFHSAKRRNCDSDEDSVMLLLDALLNFSKSYLPSTRGGSMDAPLVLSSRIDPEEIDDESHNIDTMTQFPLEFFKKCEKPLKPQDILDLVDNVEKRLGTPEQYEGLMFSHNTSNIHAGPNICLYKTLPSMKEKVESQIGLAEKIRAVDQKGVVEGVLSSHFLPDIMGNIRAFSKQKVRCTKCNSKYRRIPLSGKCRCGSNLILSVSKGSVSKYLEISRDLAGRYPINPYLKQRLEILEFGINSLFESDKSKQSSLDAFL